MKKIETFYGEEILPVFQSFVDTLLIHHSESLQDLDIPHQVWFNNTDRFPALTKLNVGDISAKELVHLFRHNRCPNLLELIVCVDDSKIVEQNVFEEVCIVPTLRKLRFDHSHGQHLNHILKMFPGLQELEFEGHIKDDNLMKNLPNTSISDIWKLKISSFFHSLISFDIGKVARNFPKLEDLQVYGCRIEISDGDEEFEFACMQNLVLEDIEIFEDTINILAAKLPILIDFTK